MAEALARHLASDVIEVASAGLAPFGEIVWPTREALAEIGVGLDQQYSKPVRPEALEAADLIVNLSGHSLESVVRGPGRSIEEWKVTDPYGENVEVYRRIRDEIAARVRELAERLRATQSEQNRARVTDDLDGEAP